MANVLKKISLMQYKTRDYQLERRANKRVLLSLTFWLDHGRTQSNEVKQNKSESCFSSPATDKRPNSCTYKLNSNKIKRDVIYATKSKYFS